MPTMPPTFRRTGPATRREQRQVNDRDRRIGHAWRAWYGTAKWQAIRAQQLRDFPLCAECAREEHVRAATICDHVEPHRGDPEKFWNGPFQSLCKPHHDVTKQLAERGR